MHSGFLFPMILRPSRITSRSCTLIDDIFINNPLVTEFGLIFFDNSTHLLVFLTFPVEDRLGTSETDKYSDLHSNKRYITPHDMAAFSNELLTIDCSFITEQFSVDVNFQLFMNSFKKKYYLVSKLHKICSKPFNHTWITYRVTHLLS